VNLRVRPAFVMFRSSLLPARARLPGSASVVHLSRVAASALSLGFVLPLFLGVSASVAMSIHTADVSPSPTGSASASPGVPSTTAVDARASFGIGTTSKGRFDARSGIVIRQERGSSYDDTVAVVNLSKFPLKIRVYAVDVVNSANGDLAPMPYSAPHSDASAWVTLHSPGNIEQVEVPALGKVELPLTIRIPDTALVGDHLVGLMASLTSAATTSGELATKIDLEQRVGIRLAIRVAGELVPAMEISDLRADYVGTANPVGLGSVQLSYVVKNTGNVRLGAKQAARIHGPVGSAATSADLPTIPILMPGGSATVSVLVPGVTPVGYMTADLTVIPVAAQGDSDPGFTVVTSATSFYAVAWPLAAVVVLIAPVVALTVVRPRLRAARLSGRHG